MTTPHINAKTNDIAKIVLMPGDPLRAKFMAEKYLDDYKLVSAVRGMLAFTGTYKDKRVTIMGHGMGMPSIGIYVYELYKFYDVENIIRFGSCSAYEEEINLFDIIIAPKAYSESNFGKAYGYNEEMIDATPSLLKIARDEVKDFVSSNKVIESIPNTSLWFYKDEYPNDYEYFKSKGIGCGEMEVYALYVLAKYFNKSALGLLGVANHSLRDETTSPKQRENGFTEMMQFMLNIVDKI